MIPEILTRERMRTPQSVFGSSSLGSTGDPPVPSGDPPDGTGVTVRANEAGLFTRQASAIPVGGSPTGAGESPALPIFKTRSQAQRSVPRDSKPYSVVVSGFRPAHLATASAALLAGSFT